MRRALACLGLLLAVAAALVLFAVAGCAGKLTGTPKGNAPPHTVLFVSGELDTVNHVVHLYWFGTDPDGSVQGFEWQLKNPVTPADTAWHFTTKSDSIFTVLADTGYTNTEFSVRAIDDAGVRDPHPPRQKLEFSNQPPTVKLVQKPLPTDTTFASVSVTWTAGDIDGDVSKLRFLVWLDGRETTPELTTETQLTMPSDRFPVNGIMTTGRRKLFVQAIDDGGRSSAIDSVTWIVRRPVTSDHARLLIVDDGPNDSPTVNTRYDTLYSNPAARVGLSTRDYTILRLDVTQPFRTAKDMEQTFKLFDSVIWYRGNRTTSSSVLGACEAGIGKYLEANGKNFFLEGLYTFRDIRFPGSLSEEFVSEHLNTHLIRQFSPVLLDSLIGFGNNNPSHFEARLDVGGGRIARDPITVNNTFAVNNNSDGGGLRQFATEDSTEVALWAQPGTLTPANADRVPVGVSVAQPGGGRAVVLCTALAVAPSNNGGVSAFVTNLYRHFGLDR